MKLKKISLEEYVEYTGNIVKYSIDDDKRFFRLFVEVSETKGITLMKCIRYSEYYPSPLGMFCEQFDIIDEHGNVDFEELIGRCVAFSVNLGKDGNYYIYSIEPLDEEDEDDE